MLFAFSHLNESFSAYNYKQIFAGKTGTTSSNKDAWFCGFSAYYTTAVWIGYDTPREMAGMYGSTYPLKIWSSFMNDIHSKLEKKDFEIPSSLQLRRVSNGQLTKETKEISYKEGKRYYSQRPDGYDYYSTQNEEKNSEWEVNYKLEKTKKAAEKAVSEFEEYKIDSVKKALNFEKTYNRVVAVIEEIPDEYEQTKFKERVGKKYNSLNEDVMNNWQEAIKEYQEDKVEKAQKQQEVDAEDAMNKAKETVKKNRIKKLQWYIDTLNKRKYYTAVTKKLIKDGNKALKRVEGYDEYDSMQPAWEAAVTRAKGLPEEPENPVVDPSSSDNKEIDKGQYVDATATPEPTAVPQQ